MRVSRGYNHNNCPRVHLISTLLPSKYLLRTHTNPHYTSHPRIPQHPTNSHNLMTPRLPYKHCYPTQHKLHK
uniref:Uncharacterized protein n=1 Tax=Pseudonaja textilis TaxID=8673 RepID=A0A670ZIA0_PSETE